MNPDHSGVEGAIPLASIGARGVVATTIALALNTVFLAIGRRVLSVPSGFEPLQWQPVLVTTAAGAIGGTVTYALLDRLTARTDRAFFLIAALVLLGSFIPLVTDFLPRLPATVVGFVALLHVVVAVVTVGSFVGWQPSDERKRG